MVVDMFGRGNSAISVSLPDDFPSDLALVSDAECCIAHSHISVRDVRNRTSESR